MPALHKKPHKIAAADHQVEPLLAVTNCDIQKLRPNPNNPRIHTKKQIQQLANSIQHLGFNVPVLVNRELQIVAGHGRVEAAKFLGMSRIPTIRLDHLNDIQVRAFMIADNRLTDQSTWDERLLAENLEVLSHADLNFSLEVTGFEMGEIDVIVEGFASASEEGEDAGDKLPELNSGTNVAQRGDVWSLGRHRVVCGSALDVEVYTQLMEGRHAAAVFTDPPYNDPIEGFVTRSGKIRHPKFAMATGELSEAEFAEFLHKAFSMLVRNSAPGALHYIFMDWRHLPELLGAADRVFTEFKNLCVWVKDTGGLGSLYRSQHELVLVFKGGHEQHRNNVQLGRYGRYRTNVWHYPRVNPFGKTNPEAEFTVLHPTVKPVSLVADAILDSTARGDIVLDPFLGSGTTLIAAERVGRICYGIELTAAYVDLAIRRWQRFTGQAAIHCQSRQPFREREEAADEKR